MPTDAEVVGVQKDYEYLRNDLTEVKAGIKELTTKFDTHVATMDDRYAKKTELMEHKRETKDQIDRLGERVAKFTGALWVTALTLMAGLVVEIVRIITHT